MTDHELNEIFRAIRNRRTLSWATIEKLAMEVRKAKSPPAPKMTPHLWRECECSFMMPSAESIRRIHPPKDNVETRAFMPTQAIAPVEK